MSLSIGVLVDLSLTLEASGHVKSWERLAEAATDFPEQLDLTVHFLGGEHQVIQLAKHVRYVLHPPIFSTERLPFLDRASGQTDLAPSNRKLLPYLQTCDVIHATHPLFTFGRTAMQYAQRSRTPLVSSIHTDTVKHGQICVADVIRRLTGRGAVSRLLNDKVKVPARWAAAAQRKLLKYWSQCDRVLVSQAADFQHVAQVLPRSRISYLRRGLNRTLFSPHVRDRRLLQSMFGVPKDKFLVLFVGRLDATKHVMTLARAVRLLRDRGCPVHAMMVGQGGLREEIRGLLGDAVTLPGTLTQSVLAQVYASADLFAFPSQTETYGNVVLEAKACGLPVLVSTEGGSAQLVQHPGEDGLLIHGDEPQFWAEAIDALHDAPSRLAAMRQAVLKGSVPWVSWRDVLIHDLLPVWQAVGYPLGRKPRRDEAAYAFHDLSFAASQQAASVS